MFGVNDKKMKLEQAKLQLDELQKNTSHIEARNRDIKADFEKTAVSYQQQMINKIWAQAGMKALAEIADIYPRMTSIHDSSLFDDSFAMDFINYATKLSIVQCTSTSATSTRLPTLLKAKVVAVATLKTGDVRRTKMR